LIQFETIPNFLAACNPDFPRGAQNRSEFDADLRESDGLVLMSQVAPSVMERYPDTEVIQTIEAALRILESEGAEIVRDFDLVGWDCDVSKTEEMPGNIPNVERR
jgi:hypothetical protein